MDEIMQRTWVVVSGKDRAETPFDTQEGAEEMLCREGGELYLKDPNLCIGMRVQIQASGTARYWSNRISRRAA